MKKTSLVLSFVLVFGIVGISFAAEFQGHHWGSDYMSVFEELQRRCLRHEDMTFGGLGHRSNADKAAMHCRGMIDLVYWDRIYGRMAIVGFLFYAPEEVYRGTNCRWTPLKDPTGLVKISIAWKGDLYDYICGCIQNDFGKPFKSGSERGIRFKGWEKGKDGLATVVVEYDGVNTSLTYYSSYSSNYYER